MHSITSLSRATGLPADTVRSWERRHGAFTPSRDERGRRVYSDSDLERAARFAALTAAGHSISALVQLSDAELAKLIDAAAPQMKSPVRSWRDAAVGALHARDWTRFETAIATAITTTPAVVALEEVVAPTLQEIGSLWEKQSITIAEEHLASAIVRQRLGLAASILGAASDGPTMVFSTISGERHELGAMMAGLVAAARRVRCVYLGPDTPPRDLIDAAVGRDAKALAVGVTACADAASAAADLEVIATELPKQIALYLGGAQIPTIATDTVKNRAKVFTNLTGFDLTIRSL